MRKRPLSQIILLVFACVLLVVDLGGQGAAAPAQAPTARPPATATATASALVPPPPLPIGTPLEQLPRFEVASVKKLSGPVTSMALRSPGGGRITMVNLPLRTIMTQSWGIRDTQIIGGPGWMTTDRFTITAKAEDNAPRDQLLLMVRSLLVERFQLKYHAEQREQQTYVLTAPPAWKPNGRIQVADCGRGAPPATGPASGPARPEQMPCGNLSLSNNVISARGLTMASFASLLSSLGGFGQVQDRTGITGTYNFQLDASLILGRSSSLTSAMAGASALTGPTADLLPSLGEGPSITSAIADLGLSVVRRRESIDVLVIDSVSQPDED